MKTRKKKYFIISGIILFIMLITGFGLVAAWGPSNCFDRDFQPGFHGSGFHPGFHGKDFSEFILWRLEKKVKELNLSDSQKEKFEKIQASIEPHLAEGMDGLRRLIEEMLAEMNKEDPDVKVLAGKIKKKIEEISGFMDENLDLFVEFYNDLDNNLKAQVLEGIREKIGKCRRS